jgi:hypothetical protein
MAIVVPLLWWGAFLMVVLGARFWAFGPLVLGMVAAVSFPPGLSAQTARTKTPVKTPEPLFLRYVPWLGMALIYFWLSRQPEFLSLIGRINSGEALRDWPIIVASLVLLATSMARRWRAVKALSDEDIYAFFEEKGKGK